MKSSIKFILAIPFFSMDGLKQPMMMPIGMKAAPDEVLNFNSCGCSGTAFIDKK